MSNNSTQEIAPTLKLRVTGKDLTQLMANWSEVYIRENNGYLGNGNSSEKVCYKKVALVKM